MTKFLFGFILCLVLVCLGVFLYFRLGLAPVATSAPAMPMERTLAGMALATRSLSWPERPTRTAIAKGGHVPPSAAAVYGTRRDRRSPGETNWKAANGIRLTGMPGFTGSLTDTQIWQVSLMLANADKLSPAAKAIVSALQ